MMHNFLINNQLYAPVKAQRGLSLIELMVSIAIGLIILAALSTLFVNQSKIRAELEKSNRMIDNGRYAMELISENLQLAGFYDNYAPSGTPTATPDPCSLTAIRTATTNLDVLLDHVQGYNASDASSNISAAPCSISAKTGSDILVLRRASTSSVTAASVAAGVTAGGASATALTNTTYLQVSNCATDSIPNYKIASGSASFTTYHKKNCTSSGSGVGDGPADLRPFLVQTYFISPDNVAGDGIPTLKRVELDHATATFVTTPLVEGIEYMQFDYGLDADADGAPDSYIAAPTATDWPNVVSVKVNIIARNLETTKNYTDNKTYQLGTAGTFGPFNDGYKRHAYTSVVRLVNPSSRKEAP